MLAGSASYPSFRKCASVMTAGSRVPKVGYHEIADQVRDAIRSGQLAPGMAVSSEPELAKQFGVTRTTARRALAQLEADGLVEVLPGRGRFVQANSESRRPLSQFEIVADALRSEIESMAAGVLVGTESVVARRFEVSQGTARRAFQVLADDGLVLAIPGRGWFTVDASGETPNLTATTARDIRAGINAGEWSIGAVLPGEVALAQKYGVARVTIRRALALLEAEGLLTRRAGHGRVVREPQS
jgi:GntR family mannosyl-D-glycerate transport/metabolism transcriptional repressor